MTQWVAMAMRKTIGHLIYELKQAERIRNRLAEDQEARDKFCRLPGIGMV